MMSLQKTFYRIFFTGLLACTGCHRDVPFPQENELHNITFSLSGFESEVGPLSGHYLKKMMGMADAGVRSLLNITPSPEPQYVYYWSFNEETLTPDIAVDEEEVSITFEANTDVPDFVNGFVLDPFEAGRALSIRGAKSLVVKLPVGSLDSVGDFSFDIKSSDTGPKAFSLSYSIDGGSTYDVLNANNQFENTGSTQRNRYAFHIPGLSELSGVESLQVKLDFLEGDRGTGGMYNDVSGTVHLDNIRLSGVYNAEIIGGGDPSLPETLRYYVFAAEDGRLIEQRELGMDALVEESSLTFKLSNGIYDVLFIAYRSAKEVLLPADITHASEFYFGQEFGDDKAVTFALLKAGFVVDDADITEPAVLTRCFSAVEFDFADVWEDLAPVSKIEITRKHENYVYTPFGIPSEVPVDDLNTISFERFASEDDFQLTFHQFLGLVTDPQNIAYQVTAFGEEGNVLNTVTLTEAIRNNVQLSFHGKLLGDVSRFAVTFDPDWEERIEHPFD